MRSGYTRRTGQTGYLASLLVYTGESHFALYSVSSLIRFSFFNFLARSFRHKRSFRVEQSMPAYISVVFFSLYSLFRSLRCSRLCASLNVYIGIYVYVDFFLQIDFKLPVDLCNIKKVFNQFVPIVIPVNKKICLL